MWKDPIVEEIHKIRDRIAAEHNYDVRALIKHYQQKERERGHKTVPRAIRRVSTSSPPAAPHR
jgi:hypothetical protein